jgi:orotate phosphoribosyltransferase
MEHRERLRTLLIERSLFVGEFTLSSGIRSTYYVDARRTTMSAEGQFLIGRVCLETLRNQGWDASHVGGLTLGADPIAYAVAHASWGGDTHLDAFTVRKAPKTHGTAQRIEGGLPRDARCVVVEDSMTSGGSALDAVRAVQEHGAQVVGVLTLVDRQEGGRERILAETGLAVVSVITAQELLDAARAASASG